MAGCLEVSRFRIFQSSYYAISMRVYWITLEEGEEQVVNGVVCAGTLSGKVMQWCKAAVEKGPCGQKASAQGLKTAWYVRLRD